MALLIPLDVLEQLAGLPKADRKRVLEALEGVAAEPGFRWPFVTEMVGLPGVWRLRKGDWQAIYRVVEAPPAPTPPGEASGEPGAGPADPTATSGEEATVANPPGVGAKDGPPAVYPDVVPKGTPDVVVIWVGHRGRAYR